MTLTPSLSPSAYLDFYGKPSTRRTYYAALKKYLSIVLGHPVADIDAGMSSYLSSRDVAGITADLTRFYSLPGISDLSPLTRRLYLSSIENYLRDCCNFSIPAVNAKLRARSVGVHPSPATDDIAPTRDILRELLAVAPPRLRCEVLICCSSGLRISELLALRFDDVYLDEVPARVVVRAENSKNGSARHSFMSSEAVESLRSFIRILPEDTARHERDCRRTIPGFKIDTSRIFPYTTYNESQHLARVLDSCGLGSRSPVTDRHLLHFHSFRKWFVTQAKKGAHSDFVESWAGHKGYLSGAYFRPSMDDERAEYLKAEPYISVLMPKDYLKIKTEQEDELNRLRASMAGYQEALSILQTRLQSVENRTPASPIAAPWILPDR